ncbi:MAG: hypothetical protein JWL85_930 [Candidatus Saccharibacteria bacterium]|nr:hypothetical protein [Candidatus Saccharibacteria bacterium]
MNENQENLLEAAKTVLEMNNQGTYTIPAAGMYPHQWLWDSCFIAIGIRHYDTERAKMELLSLLRGQWANGMLPNMILSSTSRKVRHGSVWRSWVSPHAPDDVSTSGITQPPMLAEAIVQVGKKMKSAERRSWYKTMYPALLAYHQWLYRERDPHSEGLVLQIHPWETGLDNTPPWIQELRDHQMPMWIRAAEKLRMEPLFNVFRHDVQFVPSAQRLNTIDALVFYSVQRRLRRKSYDISRILNHSLFAIEDATFNAILIRANEHLVDIAKTISRELPEDLQTSIEKSKVAYEQLWDQYSNQYYSREFITHRLLKVPSIATLMPLYAGHITQERAERLVRLLEDSHQFGTDFPIPSVPLNSEWFNTHAYWQGPTWINTNWLIIEGLKRYGFHDHAEALTETTIDLVQQSGFYEYFSPIDGSPAGINNFSWTAALTIDFLSKNKRK